VKRFSLSLVVVIAIAAMSTAAALAAPPNLTGKWNVEQTGKNGSSTATITLTQSGNGVVGTNAANGGSFTGTFVSDSKLNVTWKIATGPNSGAGWATVYVSPNGHSFNGTWGYNGKKENGSFVGNEILPPKPITTAGNWNVVAVTGPKLFGGPMQCTQSGVASICHLSAGTLDGKFRTTNKVRYKWTSKTQNGWFSFWFNDDGQSFNGTWGFGADTTPTMGRVVGQRPAGSNM
jgi:hypothetical protein